MAPRAWLLVDVFCQFQTSFIFIFRLNRSYSSMSHRMSTRNSNSSDLISAQPSVLGDERSSDVGQVGGVPAGGAQVPVDTSLHRKRGRLGEGSRLKSRSKKMKGSRLRSSASTRSPLTGFDANTGNASFLDDPSTRGAQRVPEPAVEEAATGGVSSRVVRMSSEPTDEEVAAQVNEEVNSRVFMNRTYLDLQSWYNLHIDFLSVQNAIEVGEVLTRMAALRPVPGVSVRVLPDGETVPAGTVASVSPNGKSIVEPSPFSFVCFDGFQHETISKSTSVLATYARDYNTDIAFWRLLRYNDRQGAISLVTNAMSPHALCPAALRLWLVYYIPLTPSDRHEYLKNASADLNLLEDLGFLKDQDAFASLVTLNWGVIPTASKTHLSARNFAGTREVADASGALGSARCLEFDQAVRSDTLRTTEAVRILSNWVSCLTAVTLNPAVRTAYVNSGLEDSFASTCETLSPVIALSMVWRSIATSTNLLRHDYRSTESASDDSDSLFNILRARDISVANWLFGHLVSSLALPNSVFYDAIRAASSARSYFLGFLPATSARSRGQAAAGKQDMIKAPAGSLPCVYAYLAEFHPSLDVKCTSTSCSFTHSFPSRESVLDAVTKVVSNVRTDSVLGTRREEILSTLGN